MGIGIYLQIRENKKIKNIFDIKENGRVIKGEVISVIREQYIRRKHSNELTTKFVVKFKDKNMEDKYIITQVLPDKFDYIEVVETTNNFEDIIPLEFTEYYGNGYITFDENDTVPNTGLKFNNIYLNGEKINFNGNRGSSYKGVAIGNNYKDHIICNVYEKDGRYVIDDYEGVKTNNKWNWFDYLMIIVFVVVSIIGLYFSMKNK